MTPEKKFNPMILTAEEMRVQRERLQDVHRREIMDWSKTRRSIVTVIWWCVVIVVGVLITLSWAKWGK